MKFKFCGELDAPDWLLREISIVSKMTNIRVRLLCIQVINAILGEPLDFEKIEKLVSTANFDQSDIKASIAAFHFILSNASKYDVEFTTLSNELAQLGLPKEHCEAFVKPYRDSKEKLRTAAKHNILKFPRLESVDWRVDYVMSSSYLKDLNSPSIQLNLNIQTQNEDAPTTKKAFEVPADKFRVLYYELKQARALMDSLQI